MNLKKQIIENHILSICIGIVYLWFGGLKFFAELSPAEVIAKNTISFLTMGIVPQDTALIMLAIGETILGIVLILNVYRTYVVSIAIVHMLFTFTPLLIFPEQTFGDSIFTFTLLGQYIFKNVIIIGALLTLYKLTPNKTLFH